MGVGIWLIGLIFTKLIDIKMTKILEEIPNGYENLKDMLSVYPYTFLFGGVFTAILLFGFGEVLHLLQGIKDNGKK